MLIMLVEYLMYFIMQSVMQGRLIVEIYLLSV
jgi:hypothetical protein